MAGFSLTHEERVAIAFIAHNDPRDGFVRRTWLEFKTALCGLLQRTRSNGWISVSERLPEPDTFAIVATKDGVCEALYGLGGIESPNDPPYWTVNDYGEVWPTHWMPLPEPPEVK